MTTADERREFLAELTLRNRGLIADGDQRNLANALFLVAGCGSTGGAAIEPLVRAGAMRLILVEPGRYELNNLNRQRATREALGANKAAWLAASARKINPYVEISVIESGISAENAAPLCARAHLIVDAIDVTTLAGLAAKCELHEAAAAARRPVVSAYDLAYRQYVRVFDYRGAERPLGGALASVRGARTPVEALARLVPFWAIPYELLGEIERLQREAGASISQLGCAADLFGALTVPLVLELLAGRSVKRSYVLDIKDPCLPFGRRVARRAATLAGLARLRIAMWRRS